MCTVPESEWPTDDPEVIEAIKTDFMGTWGDRRSFARLSANLTNIQVVKSVSVLKQAIEVKLNISRLYRPEHRSGTHQVHP
jgi:hypothetical protein